MKKLKKQTMMILALAAVFAVSTIPAQGEETTIVQRHYTSAPDYYQTPIRMSEGEIPDVLSASTWNPYLEMRSIQGQMNHLFDESLMRAQGEPMIEHSYADFQSSAFLHQVQMFETNKDFIVRASVPGFDKEELRVETKGNVLILSGDRKEAQQRTEKTIEGKETRSWKSRFGHFARSITIPGEFRNEGVTAEYRNGILMVTLPKVKETPLSPSRTVPIR